MFNRISKKEFDGMKDELPFGQVPLLETVEDGVIAQSMTIARYLANK